MAYPALTSHHFSHRGSGMDLYDPEGVRAFYNRYGDREWNRFETPVGRVAVGDV